MVTPTCHSNVPGASRRAPFREDRYDADDGTLQFGGWLWRHDIAPVTSSSTSVTLTYDWTDASNDGRELIGFPPSPTEHSHNSQPTLPNWSSLMWLGSRVDGCGAAELAHGDCVAPFRNCPGHRPHVAL